MNLPLPKNPSAPFLGLRAKQTNTNQPGIPSSSPANRQPQSTNAVTRAGKRDTKHDTGRINHYASRSR
jgi:hypothetical protein